VQRILDEGFVKEETCFGPVTFTYELVVAAGADSITAELHGQAMRVLIPAKIAHNWVTSDEVSLYGEQAAGGDVLKILIEKDFACIKPRTSPLWEDESDAYPNPNPSCGGK
jgi:hypothetical protein